MGRKVDPRDFLLNTDYEMDKIVYFKEGELNSGQYDIDIPHNLKFTPLIFGVCAFKSDFSDSRSVPYQQITANTTISFTALANVTNIRLSYTGSNNPGKIYYRIYAFEPTDSHAKVGGTSKNAKQFILNTDYNYCKLYKAGITTGATTLKHNLGYLPQVLAWRTANGWTSPVEFAYESDSSQNVVVKTDSVVFPGANFHYRIYYDEA